MWFSVIPRVDGATLVNVRANGRLETCQQVRAFGRRRTGAGVFFIKGLLKCYL
jgi:hypothetical protein